MLDFCFLILCPFIDKCVFGGAKCDFYHTLQFYVGFTIKVPNDTEATQMSKKKQTGEPELKGTFISVMTVGVIIAVMWFSAYALYLHR